MPNEIHDRHEVQLWWKRAQLVEVLGVEDFAEGSEPAAHPQVDQEGETR